MLGGGILWGNTVNRDIRIAIERRDGRRRRKKALAERKSGPPRWDHALGPRPVNLPGTRTVSRCAQCGTVLQGAASSGEGQCPKCGFELHSCKQCTFFDPGSRFECMKLLTERIAKKDARNGCELFEIRVTAGERDFRLPPACVPMMRARRSRIFLRSE